MKKILSEELKLPKADAPKVEPAELPKEVEEERDIHADDGVNGKPDAEAKKEKDDKESKKELEGRKDLVDKEINDADTPKAEAHNGEGKKVRMKGFNEKLTLQEPADVINEGLEDLRPWKKVEILVNDLGLEEDDILEHIIQWLPEDTLSECIDDFIRDNDLEDEFDFLELGSIEEQFPSSALDEAIPRDLAKAYRGASYKGALGYNTDLQNSDYVELTPEEAMRLYKEDPQQLKLVLGNDLIDFRDNGKPSLSHRNQYVNPQYRYKRSSGRVIYDTRRMPVKHLLKVADKIYKVKETKKDQDLLNKRRQNPESPNFEDPDENGRYDLNGYTRRGWRRGDRYDIEYNQEMIDEYRSDMIHLKNQLEAGEITEDDYNSMIADYKRRIRDRLAIIEREKGEDRDIAARKRYTSSQRGLSEPFEKYKRLKRSLTSLERNVERSKSRIDNIKQNGSEYTQDNKRRLKDYIKRLEDIQRQIDLVQLSLESADYNDADELAAAEDAYERASTDAKEARLELNKLLRRG